MSQFLVIDDERSICWSIHQYLAEDGHSVATASSIEEAMAMPKEVSPDAVLLDVRLPGVDGIEGLSQIRSRWQQSPIIVMTAHGDVETVCRALQAGAFDYLPKPFEMGRLCKLLEQAVASQPETTPQELFVPQEHDAMPLLGRSAPMQRIFRQIALAAGSNSPVLITGESGVGKECVARAIHRHSARQNEPFVPVCIPAMNPTLIESELFGHERGAFTGADRPRTGVLATANRGTVLLDEIADAPLPIQVKLLRTLETKEIWPVGSSTAQTLDFRVLAATNRDLQEMIERNEFREDLFYRLSVLRIEVPPLRNRAEDIPLLVEFFLGRFSPAGNAGVLQISSAAIAELKSRPWYGNVRELRNCIEHAATVCRGSTIDVEHLPKPILSRSKEGGANSNQLESLVRNWAKAALQRMPADAQDGEMYEEFLNHVEPWILEEVLQHVNQNRAAAARILGVHRATLRKMLREHQG